MVADEELLLRPDQAGDYVGKVVLIGLTYHDRHGAVVGQEQFSGIVESITNVLAVRVAGRSAPFTLPRNVRIAPPGLYRLRGSGEEVVNPDLLAQWSIYGISGARLSALRGAELPAGAVLAPAEPEPVLGVRPLRAGGMPERPPPVAVRVEAGPRLPAHDTPGPRKPGAARLAAERAEPRLPGHGTPGLPVPDVVRPSVRPAAPAPQPDDTRALPQVDDTRALPQLGVVAPAGPPVHDTQALPLPGRDSPERVRRVPLRPEAGPERPGGPAWRRDPLRLPGRIRPDDAPR
jgi:hypothetical protein